MWFKREQRNRRLNRGRVLDVKLRSDQIRTTRMRLATVAFCVIFGTFFGLYLFWRAGEWALDKFVYENSEFAIQNIEVKTDGAIPLDELRRWSGVKPGENLIALDLAAVKRNLELVSAIQSVSVERVLPCTLEIRVTERKPIAEVGVPRAAPSGGVAISVYQLDADGYVMQPLDPRLRVVPLSQLDASLPVISGLNVYRLQPGGRVESPQALAALQLIVAFKQSPMAGLVNLRSIDVSSPDVVVATTERGGEITFGLQDFPQQLRRWRAIYDLGLSENKAIASLDLAVANNVPVRWAEMFPPPREPRNSG